MSTEKLTPLGKHLAQLPVDVRIGKMLIFGCILRCIDPILTVAAIMSLKSPFVAPLDKRDEAAKKMRSFASCDSDHLTAARAYTAWLRAIDEGGKGAGYDFCRENFLSHNTLTEISDTKRHLCEILSSLSLVPRGITTSKLSRSRRLDGVADTLGPECNACSDDKMIIAAVMTAGLYPNVLRVQKPEVSYHDVASGTVENEVKGKELKFYTRERERVFVHPASVNFFTGEFDCPWLVFLEKVI